MTTDPAPDVERLAAALPAVLGPMFRLVRRAVAVGYQHPRLPDAQVDLLRLAGQHPGIAVSLRGIHEGDRAVIAAALPALVRLRKALVLRTSE